VPVYFSPAGTSVLPRHSTLYFRHSSNRLGDLLNCRLRKGRRLEFFLAMFLATCPLTTVYDPCLSGSYSKTPAPSLGDVFRDPHSEELIDEQASFASLSDVYEGSWRISVSTPCYADMPSRKLQYRSSTTGFFEESRRFSATITCYMPAFTKPCEKVVSPQRN
jgi:hypothetical protein